MAGLGHVPPPGVSRARPTRSPPLVSIEGMILISSTWAAAASHVGGRGGHVPANRALGAGHVGL